MSEGEREGTLDHLAVGEEVDDGVTSSSGTAKVAEVVGGGVGGGLVGVCRAVRIKLPSPVAIRVDTVTQDLDVQSDEEGRKEEGRRAKWAAVELAAGGPNLRNFLSRCRVLSLPSLDRYCLNRQSL